MRTLKQMPVLRDVIPGSNPEPTLIDIDALRRLIGWTAILLPVVMALGGWLLPTVCDYQSLSHYYYSAAYFGDLFVGALIFIGVFLILHNGDRDQGRFRWLENIFVKVAGLAAFGVALFATDGEGCVYAGERARVFAQVTGGTPPTITDAFIAGPGTGSLHYACAAVMFVFLAYYVLVVFTRVRPGRGQVKDGRLAWQKQVRNGIYYVCGGVIVIAISVMLANLILGWSADPAGWWNAWRATFVCESVALLAFGFAWLIKGRPFGMLRDPA